MSIRSRGMTRRNHLLGVILACALLFSGCAGTVTGQGDLSRIRIMAPASPGGGWDTTSRVLQRTLQRGGHRPQRSGLQRRGRRRHDRPRPARPRDRRRPADDHGPGHGRRDRDQQPVRRRSTTSRRSRGSPASRRSSSCPPTRRTRRSRTSSPPGSRTRAASPIAGGSAGGADQILAGLVAQAVGLDPKQVNYIAVLRRRRVARRAARQQGRGRHLRRRRVRRAGASPATSARSRCPEPSAPTSCPTRRRSQEQGVDVELTNWRGLMAPPGDQRRGSGTT